MVQHQSFHEGDAAVQGFYTVYAGIFKKLAEQEIAATEASPSRGQGGDAPAFGECGLDTCKQNACCTH